MHHTARPQSGKSTGWESFLSEQVTCKKKFHLKINLHEKRKGSSQIWLCQLSHTQISLSQQFGSKAKGNIVDEDGMKGTAMGQCCSV